MIKIGKSCFPQRRIKELITGCPSRLDILTTIPATNRVTEKRVHDAFSHLRRQKRHEWFNAGEDLIQFILLAKSGGDYVSRLKEIELSKFDVSKIKTARGRLFLYEKGITSSP